MTEPIPTYSKVEKSSSSVHYNRAKRRKLTPQSGKRCECCLCHQYFNTVSTFDAHRIGAFAPENTRRCLSQEEMRERGFTETSDKYWKAPISERSREQMSKIWEARKQSRQK